MRGEGPELEKEVKKRERERERERERGERQGEREGDWTCSVGRMALLIAGRLSLRNNGSTRGLASDRRWGEGRVDTHYFFYI